MQKTLVQQVAEQRRQDSEFQKQRKVDIHNYKHLIQTTRVAKKLIWEILSYTNFYDVNQSTDNSVHYTEGRRSVGKEIIELLNEIDPSLYPKIILEIGGHNVRDSNSNTRIDNYPDDSTDDTPGNDTPGQ